VVLFDKPIAIAAIAFIIVGDTLAALIGRKYGRHRFFNGKSWEGSAACFAGTLVVAVFTPGLGWPVALIGAVVAAVVEALPLGTDDNVTVPILSGLAMTLAARILIYF
jgi:dolichol kinase